MKENQRLWRTQRKHFEEKFQRIKEQQTIINKEEEKKKKNIMQKIDKGAENQNEAKQIIQEEINKKREWS